jgi:hypothetical protein
MAVVTLSGCATASIPERVRKDWAVPAERSDQDITLDYTQCDDHANEKVRGVGTAGNVIIQLFFLGMPYTLPLLPVAAALITATGTTYYGTLKNCMREAGYAPKSQQGHDSTGAAGTRSARDVAEPAQD